MAEQSTPPEEPGQPQQPGEQPDQQSGQQYGQQSGQQYGQQYGQQPGQPTPAPAAAQKRLVRSRDDRMLGGVCGGVAAYLGIDSTLLRILVVVGTVVGFGSLVLAYVIGWILIPEAD